MNAMTNRLKLSRLSLALIFGGLAIFPAAGADSARVGSYDFSYVASGDTRARPVQVFDDGRSTFFQFRAGDSVPAIFSHRTGVPQLLVPVHEGPYIKVPEIHGRFVLQVGRAQANVLHSGGAREDAPPLTVVSGAGLATPYQGGPVAPDSRLVASLTPVGAGRAADVAAHRNSYATPHKGDAVQWVEPEPKREEVSVWFGRGSAVLSPEARRAIASAAKAGAGGRFVVIGRDDDTLKEGLDRLRSDNLVAALSKEGVDPSRVVSRVGVAGTPRGKTWPSTIYVEVERPVVAAATRSDSIRTNLQELVKAGVLKPDQAHAIAAHHGAGRVAAAAPPVESPRGGFTLTAADKTVQGSIRRWAAATNYQIVWDVPSGLDAAVHGDAVIPGNTMQEALERLLAGLKDKGYALDATVFSNRVIRLTAAGRPPADSPAPATPAAAPPAPPAKPEARPPSPKSLAGAASSNWQMLQGDRTVQNMLTRWAGDAQWQLVWNAPERVAIVGDAVIASPDFRSAAEHVIAQAAAAGYRLRLTSADDRTVVVSSY